MMNNYFLYRIVETWRAVSSFTFVFHACRKTRRAASLQQTPVKNNCSLSIVHCQLNLRSLFHAFLIVNCQLLIVNCLASCSTHKEIASYQMETDSLRRAERLTVETMTVPGSQAELRIPTAELARLAAVPSEAAYVNRSGQATATVRYVRDTLVVTATCDSLQQLIYRYESELNRFRNGERAEQTKNLPFAGASACPPKSLSVRGPSSPPIAVPSKAQGSALSVR